MNTPLATATATELANYLAKLNLCVERLATLGKWRGMRQRVNLPVYDNKITLPRVYDSCLGVNRTTCCLSPRNIYGIMAPFQIAIGNCWSDSVTCISETAQTFIVPDAGFKLKVVSAVGDNGKTVKLIGGTDTDGNPIYATETLTLNAASPPTSTTTYNSLPVIQKESTAAGVELYSVIGSDVELIGMYAPSETIPAYKQYQVSSWTDQTAVEAICKVAFTPLVADTDLVFPSVVGAIAKGLQAVQYELTSDDRANERWTDALKILEDDRFELDGKQIPIMETIGEFGAGGVPNLIGDVWGYPSYPGSGYYGC